jgi:hypothetical protein
MYSRALDLMVLSATQAGKGQYEKAAVLMTKAVASTDFKKTIKAIEAMQGKAFARVEGQTRSRTLAAALETAAKKKKVKAKGKPFGGKQAPPFTKKDGKGKKAKAKWKAAKANYLAAKAALAELEKSDTTMDGTGDGNAGDNHDMNKMLDSMTTSDLDDVTLDDIDDGLDDDTDLDDLDLLDEDLEMPEATADTTFDGTGNPSMEDVEQDETKVTSAEDDDDDDEEDAAEDDDDDDDEEEDSAKDDDDDDEKDDEDAAIVAARVRRTRSNLSALGRLNRLSK